MGKRRATWIAKKKNAYFVCLLSLFLCFSLSRLPSLFFFSIMFFFVFLVFPCFVTRLFFRASRSEVRWVLSDCLFALLFTGNGTVV